jgi:hypothetical protein
MITVYCNYKVLTIAYNSFELIVSLSGRGLLKLPVYISGNATDPSLNQQMGRPKKNTIKTHKYINKNVTETYN